MKLFKVEYEGHAEVMAETAEEAESKFYHNVDIINDWFSVTDTWED